MRNFTKNCPLTAVLHVLHHALAFLSQAYGVVWKAIEKRTRQVLALKKCFDAFRNATDAQRTFREIMYLQALAGHDNLIRLQHVVKAENGRDIYLTFDHMGEDNVILFLRVRAFPLYLDYTVFLLRVHTIRTFSFVV